MNHSANPSIHPIKLVRQRSTFYLTIIHSIVSQSYKILILTWNRWRILSSRKKSHWCASPESYGSLVNQEMPYAIKKQPIRSQTSTICKICPRSMEPGSKTLMEWILSSVEQLQRRRVWISIDTGSSCTRKAELEVDGGELSETGFKSDHATSLLGKLWYW